MERTSTGNVLIADDDPLACWAIGRELSLERRVHRSVGTAKRCLEEIVRDRYDVVFLDLDLPDGDGVGLLPALRRASPATRVVAVTRGGSRKLQEDAIAAGAIQFLEKPFDPSVAGKIINGLFTGYPERREAARYHCNLRVWIRPEAGASPDAPEVCGKAEEIGPRGMRVSTVVPLEPGRTVWMRPVDPDRPFSGYLPAGGAEVAWMQAQPPGYLAGLRYLTPAGISGPGSGENRS